MIRAVLTDIEGTTSSISFVKDVLFPYARAHMRDFVTSNLDDPAVRQALDDVDNAVGHLLNIDEAIAQLVAWIDEDRKITALKALQGLIWEAGYNDGDFHGHIYPDAARYLRDWQAAGIDLYVYSSGSVYAQKLLFGHTEHGDLRPLFSGYFDTRIGAKGEADSYRRIQQEIGLPAEQILFLSDVPAELDAARASGMQTTQLLRDGTAPAGSHRAVRDFSEIRVD
ncbi:MAG: acireductone synthase [Chromatiaceae bacterium]|nr:acireductone synthase [Chromatiaceae bacterium]